MQSLLPYYEKELGFLRRYGREFADLYPKLANRLSISGESSEDPHIERMIQSFALLTARTAKKLDDEYPKLIEALFEVLYPHYLRPFPSCSIVNFNGDQSGGQFSDIKVFERGTELLSKPVNGVPCKFRTSSRVVIYPVKISSAHFSSLTASSKFNGLNASIASKISITFSMLSTQATFQQLEKAGPIRLYVDGEASFCSAFRDALFLSAPVCSVESGGSSQKESRVDGNPFTDGGMEDDDALVDFPARSHPSYRLLTEYFVFPEKFKFIDFDFASVRGKIDSNATSFTINIYLSDIRPDSDLSQVLSRLNAKNLLLNCVPVVNLFKHRAEPIRLTHKTSDYPVIADNRRPYGYDVYSIDSVSVLKQTPTGDISLDYRPFYSIKHGEETEENARYWISRRDEVIARSAQGHETRLAIIDRDFEPAAVETVTVSTQVTCTNRDLPTFLSYGAVDGDLVTEGGNSAFTIRFIKKPTKSYSFKRTNGNLWRLNSQLALNHFSLIENGVDAIKEILTLYDLPADTVSRKLIDSIVDISSAPTSLWITGKPFPCMVRGIDVTVTIDEAGFAESGIHVFMSVLNRLFGLSVHANNFSRLIVKSHSSGQEIKRWKPINGALNIL